MLEDLSTKPLINFTIEEAAKDLPEKPSETTLSPNILDCAPTRPQLATQPTLFSMRQLSQRRPSQRPDAYPRRQSGHCHCQQLTG